LLLQLKSGLFPVYEETFHCIFEYAFHSQIHLFPFYEETFHCILEYAFHSQIRLFPVYEETFHIRSHSAQTHSRIR
ncbi:hypothetical protein ACFPPD_23300, partial [Cohnella suwonensis]